MSTRTTPLGFVSGDIEVHCHCIYIYSKRDTSYIRSIADFLIAGVNAGEISICILDDPARELLENHLRQRGMDSQLGDGQIKLLVSDGLLFDQGMFTSQAMVDYWSRELLPCLRKYAGVRTFCDTTPFLQSRLLRLKLLEFEALTNLTCPSTITLCGYDSSAAGRSFLAQSRSVHPFVANSRSIKRNAAFVSTARFLSGFYRFRRVSKEYAASPGETDAIGRELEEMAARTPLTMPDIRDFRSVVEGVFAHIVDKGEHIPGSAGEKPHLHVTFVAESDKMIVTVRDHALSRVNPRPSLQEHVHHSEFWMSGLVDDLRAEIWKGDLVVTIVKRYRQARIIENCPPLEDLDKI